MAAHSCVAWQLILALDRHIYGDLRVIPRVSPPRPPTPVAWSVFMLHQCTMAHSVALDEYYPGKNQRLRWRCTSKVIGKKVRRWDVRVWSVQIEISEFRSPRPPRDTTPWVWKLRSCTISHFVALDKYYLGKNHHLRRILPCKVISKQVCRWDVRV